MRVRPTKIAENAVSHIFGRRALQNGSPYRRPRSDSRLSPSAYPQDRVVPTTRSIQRDRQTSPKDGDVRRRRCDVPADLQLPEIEASATLGGVFPAPQLPRSISG